MRFRLGVMSGALSLLLVTAAAQGADVSGTISHIEPATGLVTFTDGRIVHLEPGATLWIDGRRVTLGELKPGMVLIVKDGASGREKVATAHPPIEAMGTVAGFDQQTGILTFQDGRMVKLTDKTTAWQPTKSWMLRPGTQVFVDHAQPAGFRTTAGTWPADQRMYMGKVVRVDPSSALIELDNGAVVHVGPTTRMRLGSQTLKVSELQPGDQVVIRARETAAGDFPSALPREGLFGSRVTIEAEDIQLFRQPQAP